MTDKPRTVNFRFFVVIAIYNIAVILSLFLIYVNIFLGILSFACIIALQICLLVVYKGYKKRNFIAHIVAFVSSVIIVISFFVKVVNFNNGVQQREQVFGGTISYSWVSDDGTYAIVTLDNHSINGVVKSGKLNLYITIDSGEKVFLDEGYSVSGYGYIKHEKAFDSNGLNLSTISQNIRYSTNINISNIVVKSNSFSGIRFVRHKIIEFFNNNLSPTNSALVIAMIIGDRSYLSKDTNSVFSYSGFAHILSVSGLHFVIFATVIGNILRCLRTSRKMSFIIITVVLFLFAYLSGFSVAVIRAFIMAIIAGFCKLIGKRYDSLSSLSIASIIVLCINPFYLFDISFILSYGSVLSIIFFNLPCKKVIKKIKIRKKELPNKIVDSLAMFFAVQMIAIPLTMWQLGQFSTYSIISNIFLLPIVTIIFSLLLVITPVGLLFPFVGYVVQLIDKVINVFMFFLTSISNLPYATIYMEPNTVLIVFLLILLVLISRFIMLKSNKKLSIPIVAVMYVLVFLSGIKSIFLPYVIIPLNNNTTIISTSSSNITFISTSSASSFVSQVHARHIYTIDYMFLNTDDSMLVSDYSYYSRVFGIKYFVVPYTINTDFFTQLRSIADVKIMTSSDLISIDGFDIRLQSLDNLFLGYSIYGEKDILITAKDIKLDSLDVETLAKFDILRSSNNRRGEYEYSVQIVDYIWGDTTDTIIGAFNNQGVYFDFKNYVIGKIKLNNGS